MPNKETKSIDFGGLLDMVLINASKAGEADLRLSPHYAEYEQRQKIWNSILDSLDKSTVECYENTVNRALATYQDRLKSFFWVWGLINPVEKYMQPPSSVIASSNMTDILDDAENQLAQVCKTFASHLSEDDRKSFAEYFRHRKNCIDLIGSYCYKHGMEFMCQLMDRAGLGKIHNTDEVVTHE